MKSLLPCFYFVKLIFMFYRPHNRQMRAKREAKILISKGIKQNRDLQKKKTPFQNERVLIKIEKEYCMIRVSSGGTICSKGWEREFPGVKRSVSRHGTLCFPLRNTLFHTGELSVSYGKGTDYIPYSSILR